MLVLNIIYVFILFLMTIVPVLIGVAFLTLLERKSMASFQSRRGPNVVGFFGLLQPISDGLKLLLKETILPYKSSYLLFCIAPLLSFAVSLLLWFIIPLWSNAIVIHTNLGILLLLGFSSLNVYGVLLSGWSSNSNYAILGALRSASQMISYEISMSLTLIPVVLLSGSFNFIDIIEAQHYFWNCIILFPSAFFFYISILAETNRPPFDLPEAEAELVSGYNVEYSSLYFALFFLAEYANIILMSYIFVICFLGGSYILGYSLFLFSILKLTFIVFSFIWVRSSYPRYRFDQLMYLGWKVILPLTLSYAFFLFNLSYFLF